MSLHQCSSVCPPTLLARRASLVSMSCMYNGVVALLILVQLLCLHSAHSSHMCQVASSNCARSSCDWTGWQWCQLMHPGVCCAGHNHSSKRGIATVAVSRVPAVVASCRLVLRPTGEQRCGNGSETVVSVASGIPCACTCLPFLAAAYSIDNCNPHS
jgi:hypothetical protein